MLGEASQLTGLQSDGPASLRKLVSQRSCKRLDTLGMNIGGVGLTWAHAGPLYSKKPSCRERWPEV